MMRTCLFAARRRMAVCAHRLLSSQVSSDYAHYTCLHVTQPCTHVTNVQLNRPDKMNAFSKQMWSEVGECFRQLHEDSACRVVVLSAAGGRAFSGGIDLAELARVGAVVLDSPQQPGDGAGQGGGRDVARKAACLDGIIKQFQESFSALEHCRKPVIACVHGACVGAGVDLVVAADIRYCSRDAFFQVKEVDLGLAADIGSLQRLPPAVGGSSLARELCFTGRRMYADEALSCGLVNRVLPDGESALQACVQLASVIASKSPVAVQTTKQSLLFSRDNSVQQGLDHVRLHNTGMLQSLDVQQAAMAAADTPTSTPPQFHDL